MGDSKTISRGVVPTGEEGFQGDEVYYSNQAGLLVAKFVTSPGQPARLYLLTPNVNVSVQESGGPVQFEVILKRELWHRRQGIVPDAPIRPAQISFFGPNDYDYWDDGDAAVVEDVAERTALVGISHSPPEQGYQISPRIVVYVGRGGELCSILIRGFEVR